MWMHSIQTSLFCCNIFFVDGFELFDNFKGLKHSVHKIDVFLTSRCPALQYHEDDVEDNRRDVEGEKGIEHVKRCDVHAEERKLETNKGKYRLVFTKVVALCC